MHWPCPTVHSCVPPMFLQHGYSSQQSADVAHGRSSQTSGTSTQVGVGETEGERVRAANLPVEGALEVALLQSSSVGADVVAMSGSPPSVGWLLGVEDGTDVILPQSSSVGTVVVA